MQRKWMSMKNRSLSENGYMGMIIIILVLFILLSLAMFSVLIYPSYFSGKSVYSQGTRLTDNPILSGDVTGYADISGRMGYAEVSNPLPAPAKLGAVQMKIQLDSVRMMWQTGTGVDLGKAKVSFITPSGSEILQKISQQPMTKPGWEIVQKGSTLPGQGDNGNDLLEPNEAFVIFVYPAVPLSSKTPFSVLIQMPDENPIWVNRTVPSPVISVMDLG
jgi:hypothetical protein